MSTKAVYKFKNTFSGDAEEAWMAIEKVRLSNDGMLTADAIVNHAKPETNSLHAYFEWNDSIAGHHWRKHTARQLIRSIDVIYVSSNDASASRPQPAFINVIQGTGKDRNQYYQRSDVATSDEFSSAIEELQKKLMSLSTSIDGIEVAAKNKVQIDQAAKIKASAQRFQMDIGAVIHPDKHHYLQSHAQAQSV